MKLNFGHLRTFPKLVVLSTLLTWAGRGGQLHQSGADGFASRVPALGYANTHATENTLYSMYVQSYDVNIIGVGLVYGKGGFDFEKIFR